MGEFLAFQSMLTIFDAYCLTFAFYIIKFACGSQTFETHLCNMCATTGRKIEIKSRYASHADLQKCDISAVRVNGSVDATEIMRNR